MTRVVNQDYLATSAEIGKTTETNVHALLPEYNFHSPTFRNSHNLAIILTLSGPSEIHQHFPCNFSPYVYMSVQSTIATEIFSYKCNLKKECDSWKIKLKDLGDKKCLIFLSGEIFLID